MKTFDDPIELGKRIKKAREDAKLTQYKLHDLTGISITQISAYENGNRNIGLQSLHKIAKATNKTIDEIYVGSSELKPIMNASNKGELIVNCISALVDEEVITSLPRQNINEYISEGTEYYYQLGLIKHAYLISDLVNKLVDFCNNKENYFDPETFKKQILVAAAKQINKNN